MARSATPRSSSRACCCQRLQQTSPTQAWLPCSGSWAEEPVDPCPVLVRNCQGSNLTTLVCRHLSVCACASATGRTSNVRAIQFVWGVFSCEKRIFCVREGTKNLAVSAPKRRLVRGGRAQKKCGNFCYNIIFAKNCLISRAFFETNFNTIFG